ncbi:F-box protein CPR1-like [Silene latifolia]|uniref:F-box protein CPR1-like n=1 Tax=Silene latifolia TaxID=37657 RepID=UPI003D784012
MEETQTAIVNSIQQISLSSPPPQPVTDAGFWSRLEIDFVLTEILPKLPSKSLIRYKSVSKSFKTLISSPSFIRRHLRESISSSTNRLLVIPSTSSVLYIFNLDPPSSVASATFRWSEGDISVVGACNGLILITCYVATLMILNPSTRTYVDIIWASRSDNFGFGFDEATEDYKIVNVSDVHSGNGNVVKKRITTVYSVNLGTWKVVDQMLPDDSMEDRFGGVLIDNCLLHWMFWSPSKKKRRIGCFDIRVEKWVDDVMLPEYYYNSEQKKYLLDFGVVDGRLFSSFENRVSSCYDVWVMKVYGVSESWVKLSSVAISENLTGGVVPVASRGVDSSVVLLRQRHRSKLFWYNKENGAISVAKVPSFWNLQPYVCKGSLVDLPGAKLFGDVYERPPAPQQE